MNYLKEMENYLADIPVIDTHEHLPLSEAKRNKAEGWDVFCEYLIHYLPVDLISSGMTEEIFKQLSTAGLSVEEKWKIFEPYWRNCQYTGYAQSLKIAARDLHGIEIIDSSTIGPLNHSLLESLNPSYFKIILKDKCRIHKIILDKDEERIDSHPDPDYFIPVHRIDRLVYPETYSDLILTSEESGISITSFDDYLEACTLIMERYHSASNLLKCALAYKRSLFFENASYSSAEIGFLAMLETCAFHLVSGTVVEKDKIVLKQSEDLQNYLMHYILNLANRKGSVLQIHTGLQEGNYNYLRNSDPLLLNNLFLRYPKIKFDIFHIGYPFQASLAPLAKMFPNVHINMCWSHIISPLASRRALNEWIECLPFNKISAFGGDYRFVDGVYGHLQIAKANVAHVLAQKINEGILTIKEAEAIALALMYENPCRLYEVV